MPQRTRPVTSASPTVTSAGRTHRDSRPVNEDAFFHGDRVLAIADGMGGHPDGDVASQRALAVIAELDARSPLTAADVSDAVKAAHRQVHQPDRPRQQRMGTTLTVLAMDGWSAHLGHVGDTRVYLFRDGDLECLTTDHTVASELGDADVGGRTNTLLTRSLGTADTVEVDGATHELRPGDRLLLSTDGLHDHVDDAAIARLMREHPEAGDCADALLDEGLRSEPGDNVTVLVANLT